MSEPTQECPICKCGVRYDGRYTRYVCNECQKNSPPLTEDGEKIVFGNEGHWGGFLSVVNNQKTEVPIHKCYINGIECYADEARFGGIVIQAAKQATQVKVKKEEA